MSFERISRELGLEVFQRGWLSSNNVFFRSSGRCPAALVDTGYVAHADQTLSLVETALCGEALGLVLNTHLHSDHCGGNAALQDRHGCEIRVPAASSDNVRRWDEARLSFRATGQRCDRFVSDGDINAGQTVLLGRHEWQVYAAPGHDPDALMLYQPDARVLISADALWEERLAIIFPELDGASGFGAARSAIALIESLAPSFVIPGHGRPFSDVAGAITQSRRRIDAFEREPRRHAMYGARALTMFHMLEHRNCTKAELKVWLLGTPVFEALYGQLESLSMSRESFTETLLQGLVDSGLLSLNGHDELRVVTA